MKLRDGVYTSIPSTDLSKRVESACKIIGRLLHDEILTGKEFYSREERKRFRMAGFITPYDGGIDIGLYFCEGRIC